MIRTAYCDSHIHVVGQAAHYPLSPGRSFTPPAATIDAVQGLGDPHGVTRFVIVQPSFYGTDNTVLLETLDRLGPDGRGVAVLDPADAPPSLLQHFAQRGVRGLRLNLYSTLAGQVTRPLAAMFGAAAELAAGVGWHVQVIAPLPVLAEAAPILAASPAPVVIDHYGLPGASLPDDPDGKALLDLLRLPHVWMKLSAPYRSGRDPVANQPDPRWIAALLAVAAERCVWGSDWPWTPKHPQHGTPDLVLPYRALDYAAMLTAFRDALPSDDVFGRIMRDNPARLYGF